MIPQKFKYKLKELNLSWWYFFSHHPLCDKYKDHLFIIGPLVLCQGCTLIFIGFNFSVLVLFMINPDLMASEWFLVIIAIILIVFFPEILDKYKIFVSRKLKRVSRFSIGTLGGIYLWYLLTGDLLTIIISSVVFMISFILFTQIRKKKQEYCHSCSELSTTPNCSGLIHRERTLIELSNYKAKSTIFNIKKRVITKKNK